MTAPTEAGAGVVKHTLGPWRSTGLEYGREAGWFVRECNDDRYMAVARISSTHRDREEIEANARLIAAAPDYHEAAIVQHACGLPERVSLYDEEGIEGWRWTHPDGREWFAVGDWSEPPPMHPLMAAAHAKATGAQP